MNKITKAALLNIALPGLGYVHYKIENRKTIGWVLTILTFAEIALFLYVPIAYSPGQYTFNWSPLYDPSRWVLRVVLALDTYFVVNYHQRRSNRTKQSKKDIT